MIGIFRVPLSAEKNQALFGASSGYRRVFYWSISAFLRVTSS